MSEQIEQLIEAYCTAYDELSIAEDSGDECGMDDASVVLADAGNAINDAAKSSEITVVCNVEWPNGRVLSQVGRLKSVGGEDCYIENDLGTLAGDIRSLELA